LGKGIPVPVSKQLREVMLQLLGLGSVVGSTDKFYHDIPNYADYTIEFPTFGLPALVGKKLKITAGEQDLEKADRSTGRMAGPSGRVAAAPVR
jgi:hypothetical protein